nr:zinc finger BED domain-containing protein RICESLEEPER 2-like [Ipomoea batatas]
MSTGNSSVPQNPNNSSSAVGESNEAVQVDNELQEQKVMESAGKIDMEVYETFGSQVSHQRSAYNWDDFDACCEQVDTSRVQKQGNWDDFDAYCEEVETSRVQRQESRTTAIFDL